MSQEEIERMLAGGGAGASEPAPEPAPSSGSSRTMSQEEIEKMLAGGMGASEPEPAGDRKMSQEEIEKMLAGGTGGEQPQQQAPVPPPAAQPQMPPYGMPPAPAADGSAPAYPGYPGYPPMYYPPYPYPPQQPVPPAPAKPDPKVINTQPAPLSEMDGIASLGKEQAENLDLIMEVPLQVTVEIGRTERKVQDILEFSKGSLVVLDKLAGDEVDLFVNGKCIARGDVVVIDDNFGVRITEIVQKPGIEISAKKK